MRAIFSLFVMILALASTPRAEAHEFWLSPEQYQVAPGAPIRADIRVGQNFKGAAYSYVPINVARFDIVTGGVITPVTARMGDRPALSTAMPGEGLIVIVHETTDTMLTYSEWQKFADFVTHKAFPDALERHAARGLPRTGFRESYRRFAKSLIAVGDGAGQDHAVGLETEIVALANPYTDALPAGLPIQALYQGAPRQGAQIEVFEKAPDGTVHTVFLTTDANGHTDVPVKPGHEYLLDAVVLRDTGNDDPKAGPVWRSLWASLTFRMPE
ncbi:MAG: hypothetical protein CL814_08605 [Confluentimicrobium sp.]|uniref:DUF4198 domain-containing protein n=1 Tax=Actibacterium sp. TaxID=1872125 RepID=UPI000C4B92B6|nr:DUF4198 domain-containing protein [Actibacterium sp.]MBC56983.1 hypothetical protein [Actibacterium sp.]